MPDPSLETRILTLTLNRCDEGESVPYVCYADCHDTAYPLACDLDEACCMHTCCMHTCCMYTSYIAHIHAAPWTGHALGAWVWVVLKGSKYLSPLLASRP